MEIRNLRAFKKVAEMGSYTRAAQELGYAQSTLTTQIQAIEAFYRKPVFERLGKSFKLTSFGRKLLENTDALLTLYDNLEHVNDENDETQPEGLLRIGAPESLMMYRLFPLIMEYKRLYPRVQISIINDSCEYLRSRILNGDLDITFLLQPDFSYTNLTTLLLKEEAFCLAAPAGYTGSDFIPEENQMVLFTEKECTYRQSFDTYLKSHKYYPVNIVETQSVEAIKKFILNNLGMACLPFYAIEDEIAKGLIKHRHHTLEPKLYTQLIYHKNKWLHPALQRFIKLCSQRSTQWN